MCISCNSELMGFRLKLTVLINAFWLDTCRLLYKRESLTDLKSDLISARYTYDLRQDNLDRSYLLLYKYVDFIFSIKLYGEGFYLTVTYWDTLLLLLHIFGLVPSRNKLWFSYLKVCLIRLVLIHYDSRRSSIYTDII